MNALAARPPPPTPAESLRRWLCAWLALWIALQGASSALMGVQGVWHRHRPVVASAPATTALALRGHGTAFDAHARWHDEGRWHRHAATDDSVWAAADDAARDAVGHLASVFAPGVQVASHATGTARHVQVSARAWWATMRAIAPPLRPPRA